MEKTRAVVCSGRKEPKQARRKETGSLLCFALNSKLAFLVSFGFGWLQMGAAARDKLKPLPPAKPIMLALPFRRTLYSTRSTTTSSFEKQKEKKRNMCSHSLVAHVLYIVFHQNITLGA